MVSTPESLPGPAAGPRRRPGFVLAPFTHHRAREAGIGRRALESPEFRMLLRGIYVSAAVTVDARVEAQAALLAARDGAFVTHQTAARLWGGVVPHSPALHVGVGRGTRRARRRDLVVHESSRTPWTFRTLRVTSPLDTFLDLATSLHLVDLVILGDSLVRRERFTPVELVRHCAGATGRGVRVARRAAGLVRAGVDSPMETRSWMLRVLSGLPELETDIRFSDAHGRLLRRLDAGDRATRTAVEYDGRQHIEREQAWEADIGRREEFEDEEWRIITLVSRDIYASPEATVDRLRRIFRKRGIPLGRPSEEWRRHFPGRS